MQCHLGATDAEGELSCMRGGRVASTAPEVRANHAEMINVHH